MSDGSTGAVTVTYAATGGTVSDRRALHGGDRRRGAYRVIAVQQGGTKADTSAVTVTATTPPPPCGDGAEPERRCRRRAGS